MALLLGGLMFGGLLAWGMATLVDRDMRAELLQETQLVANALNPDYIRALTGTEADLNIPEYRRLKDQLNAVRQGNPHCRFLYLMGRKADGTVFFFVDSETVGSKDYSPPGQVYGEVTETLRHVFAAHSPAVEGPVTDRLGTWVSALVPLPDSQATVVLGMDLDASTWKWTVARKVALPAALLSLMLCAIYIMLQRAYRGILARLAALGESEKRFRDVMYASHDAILLIDGNAFVDCNEATVKMLGYADKNQFLMTHPSKLSPPVQPDGKPSFEKAEELIRTALEKGYHRFEWTHRKADGDDFVVEVSLTSVVMEGKNVLHCVWRDISEHKRIEEALVRERQLLRMIIDNIPDGIYAKDTQGRKTLANRADVRCLGRESEAEVLAQDDFAFFRPEDAAKFAAIDRSVMDRGQPILNHEESFTNAQGDVQWLLTSKLPLRASDGQVIGLLGIWHNITARRRIEEAMKKRVMLDVCLSQMIRSLLRGMKSGATFADPLAILGRGNKASRVFLFQDDLDEDGSRLMRIVDQWAADGTAPYPTELQKPGIPYPEGWADLQRVMHGGVCYFGDSRRWSEKERGMPWREDIKTFLLAPVFVEMAGGRSFWGFLAFVQCDEFRNWDENDVEITKAAADLLGAFLTRREEVEQLHLLGAAVESAQESFIITDAQLAAPGPHILFANPAAEKLSGYRRDELVGRTPRIFQGPLTNQEALRRLKEELGRGSPFHGVTTNYRKDGTPFLIDWNIAPVRNQTGKITHFVSVQRDITEQQAMVKRVARANKMESVGSLASGIAHEINSPAQFIGDNVQYAYDVICNASARLEAEGVAIAPQVGQPLFEEVPLALKDALEGVSRIDKIVKSMREFAHPGEEIEPSDLNRCLEVSTTVCRNEWKHVARVDFDLDPNLPPVPCVRSDINQVVVNLVVNAAQAIAGQKRSELGRILLSTRVSEGWAELRVEDDGPGIPQEIAEKIFNPFFTTKPVGQGTGQGLFLTHQCIEGKHHGRISTTNISGGGACFLIQLPLEPLAEKSS